MRSRIIFMQIFLGIIFGHTVFAGNYELNNYSTISNTPPYFTSVSLMDPAAYDEQSGSHLYSGSRIWEVSLVYGRENHSDVSTLGNFEVTVNYTLEIYDIGQQLLTPSYSGYQLKIKYNSAGGSTLVDMNSHDNVPNGYVGKVVVNSVSVSGTAPNDIRLELGMINNKYFELKEIPAFSIDHEFIAQSSQSNDELLVFWEYMHGAEEYQLEWLFLDGEHKFWATYNGSSDIFAEADLGLEPIRVTLSDNFYKIPLIYPHGKLFYRVRAVGTFYDDPGTPDNPYFFYSNWVDQKLSGGVAAYSIASGNDFEETKIWQVQQTFSENGKNKKVITYYDETLRQRQALTNLSTNNQVAIVETKYDYEGRPVITTLPDVTSGSYLGFREELNMVDVSGTYHVFNKADFDKDDGIEELAGVSGPAKYYSSDLSNSDYLYNVNMDYLPKAEGYPFSQVRYTRDNTGKVISQSGVGDFHRIKEDGRQTKYFYTTPTSTMLHRLFGSNVGNVAHYKQEIVLDANGQVSVAYKDQEGRTIATALRGESPDNVNTLPSNNPTNIVESIIDGNKWSEVDNSYELDYKLFNDAPTSYDFAYEVGTLPDNTMCADCKYLLTISVKDPDGENYIITGGASVTPSANWSNSRNPQFILEYDNAFCSINAEVEFTNFQFNKVGEYTITKRLQVILPAEIPDEVEMPDLGGIQDGYESEIDYTLCDELCIDWQECSEYGDIDFEGFVDAECESYHQQMRQQVGPGGVYFDDLVDNQSDYGSEFFLSTAFPNFTLTNSKKVFAFNIFETMGEISGTTWTIDPTNDAAIMALCPSCSTLTALKENWSNELALRMEMYHPEQRLVNFYCSGKMKETRAFDKKMALIPGWKEATGEESFSWNLLFNSHTTPSAYNFLENNVLSFSGAEMDPILAIGSQTDIPSTIGVEVLENSTTPSIPSDITYANQTLLVNLALPVLLDNYYPDLKGYYQTDAFTPITPTSATCGSLQSGVINVSSFYDPNNTFCISGATVNSLYSGVDFTNSEELSKAHWRAFRGAYANEKMKVIKSIVFQKYFNDFINYFGSMPLCSGNVCLMGNIIPNVTNPDPAVMPPSLVYTGSPFGFLVENGQPYADAVIKMPNPVNIFNPDCFDASWNVDPTCLNSTVTSVQADEPCWLVKQSTINRWVELINYSCPNTISVITPTAPSILTISTVSNPIYNAFSNLYDTYNYGRPSCVAGENFQIANADLSSLATALGVNLSSACNDNCLVPSQNCDQRVFTWMGKLLESCPNLANSANEIDFGTTSLPMIDNCVGKDFEIYWNGLATGTDPLLVDYVEYYLSQYCYEYSNVLNENFSLNHINIIGTQYLQAVEMALDAAGCISLHNLVQLEPAAQAENTCPMPDPCIHLLWDLLVHEFNDGFNPLTSSPAYLTINLATNPEYDFLFECLGATGNQIKIDFADNLLEVIDLSTNEALYSLNFFYGSGNSTSGPGMEQFYWDGVNAHEVFADPDMMVTIAGPMQVIPTAPTISGYTFSGLALPLWYQEMAGVEVVSKNTMLLYLYCAGETCPDFTEDCPEPYDPNSGDDCEAFLLAEAMDNAQHAWQDLAEEAINEYYTSYLENCKQVTEKFSVSHSISEYHYTLYYYDQAGNLVQTVPPEGIVPPNDLDFNADGKYIGSTAYVHRLPTTYKYNSLNQVIEQNTPDAGLTEFWYNRASQLRFSRNAEQNKTTTIQGDNDFHKYSYTKYDYQGRIQEVGQVEDKQNETVTSPALPQYSFTLLLTAVGSNRYNEDLLNFLDNEANPVLNPSPGDVYNFDQMTFTYYDGESRYTGWDDINYRSRVTSSYLYPDEAALIANNNYTASYYKYDPMGNVTDYVQRVSEWADKLIKYDFDLVSGKVTKVSYQPGEDDEFYHKYEYDADNRLTNAYTSSDNRLWEEDAEYFYYPHGPLARMELGEDKLQGNDYYYTIHGWLKGVNMPYHLAIPGATGECSGISSGYQNYDPGKDGYTATGQLNQFIGRDQASFALGYYNGDYSPIHTVNMGNAINTAWSGGLGTLALPATTSTNRPKGLYNGNIAWMITDIPGLEDIEIGQVNTPMQAMVYQYDQLNRITKARSSKYLHNCTGGDGPVPAWGATSQAYAEDYTYDANGNIESLSRREQTGALMDDLDYKYNVTVGGNKFNNRLNYVDEPGVSSSTFSIDIDDQGTNNYGYDAIGNLIKDGAEQINPISWTVYGKIAKIGRSSGSEKDDLEFLYDPAGNRVKKLAKKRSSPGVFKEEDEWESSYYVRDASGNIMAVYTYKKLDVSFSGERTLLPEQREYIEYSIYGSSRVGTKEKKTLYLADELPENNYKRITGDKRYELSNHLGNVLAVIADDRIGYDVNSDDKANYYEPVVMSAQDYYPFGMLMPGRQLSTGYRFGFNGKEMDNEVSSTGNQYDYGFRIYNPRIGKFLSVDPLTKDYPMLTPYQYASNMPTRAKDLDGLEADLSPILGPIFKDAGITTSTEQEIQKTVDNVGNSINTQAMNGAVNTTFGVLGTVGAAVIILNPASGTVLILMATGAAMFTIGEAGIGMGQMMNSLSGDGKSNIHNIQTLPGAFVQSMTNNSQYIEIADGVGGVVPALLTGGATLDNPLGLVDAFQDLVKSKNMSAFMVNSLDAIDNGLDAKGFLEAIASGVQIVGCQIEDIQAFTLTSSTILKTWTQDANGNQYENETIKVEYSLIVNNSIQYGSYTVANSKLINCSPDDTNSSNTATPSKE